MTTLTLKSAAEGTTISEVIETGLIKAKWMPTRVAIKDFVIADTQEGRRQQFSDGLKDAVTYEMGTKAIEILKANAEEATVAFTAMLVITVLNSYYNYCDRMINQVQQASVSALDAVAEAAVKAEEKKAAVSKAEAKANAIQTARDQYYGADLEQVRSSTSHSSMLHGLYALKVTGVSERVSKTGELYSQVWFDVFNLKDAEKITTRSLNINPLSENEKVRAFSIDLLYKLAKIKGVQQGASLSAVLEAIVGVAFIARLSEAWQGQFKNLFVQNIMDMSEANVRAATQSNVQVEKANARLSELQAIINSKR